MRVVDVKLPFQFDIRETEVPELGAAYGKAGIIVDFYRHSCMRQETEAV